MGISWSVTWYLDHRSEHRCPFCGQDTYVSLDRDVKWFGKRLCVTALLQRMLRERPDPQCDKFEEDAREEAEEFKKQWDEADWNAKRVDDDKSQ